MVVNLWKLTELTSCKRNEMIRLAEFEQLEGINQIKQPVNTILILQSQFISRIQTIEK